jgi:hypothetical protein
MRFQLSSAMTKTPFCAHQSWEVENQDNRNAIQAYKQELRAPLDTEKDAFATVMDVDQSTNRFVIRRGD